MSRRARRPRTREEFATLASGRRPNDWTAAGVRRRCAFSAGVLLARGVDIAAIDAWWPGGENNQQTRGIGPWVMCYAHYHHLARTTDRGSHEGDTVLQQAIVDGITDQPAYVACSDGVTRAISPKSLPVHLALSALAERLDDITQAPQEWGLRALQWVWIVAHEGTGAPFDVRPSMDEWPTEIPPWLDALTPVDVFAFVQAFNRIDRAALMLMCTAFATRSNAPSKLSFAGFLGTVAKDRDVKTLSVKHIIATTLSEYVANEEARERAEAEAAAKPKRR